MKTVTQYYIDEEGNKRPIRVQLDHGTDAKPDAQPAGAIVPNNPLTQSDAEQQ